MNRSHIRHGDRLPPPSAGRVEGRVLRIDRDDLLVDWGGRLGTVPPLVGGRGAVRAGAAAGARSVVTTRRVHSTTC